MSDNYPPIPDEYKGYMNDAVALAETALHDETGGDAIPGKFTNKEHIPHELVEAVISRESGWNIHAVNQTGYCNNYGGRATGLGQFCINPGGDVGGSLELSDFQAVTGHKVTQSDLADPKKSIMLVAFGLGDRYERLPSKDKKNWIKSVEGYSPVPGNSPETQAYEQDIYSIIERDYGKKRADEIQGNAGKGESCKWYDIACNARLIAGIGHDAATGTAQHEKNTLDLILGIGETGARGVIQTYFTKYLLLLAGVGCIVLGVILLAQKRGRDFVAANPEVLAAL